MEYLAVAILLLGLAVFLVLRSRAERSDELEPYRPDALSRTFDSDKAYEFARRRLDGCDDLDATQIRDVLGWCSEYVRSHVAPLNGGGPRDGWLMPPNMFEVVEHVQRRAGEHDLVVKDECLWEIVGAHDDFMRSG